MNRRFQIVALIVLASIPAVSFASDSLLGQGLEFAGACIAKPISMVHTVFNSSPHDIWNQATNMTIAKLPIISSFLQTGKQKDYATELEDGVYPRIQEGYFYTKYNYPILTAALAVGGYTIATNKWQARTKLVNALKFVRSKVCPCTK